jgi:DNA-directed RNA polymerase subunit beta
LAARTATGHTRVSNRISFAKITEPLELPKLLSLQTDSFDWLIGNEAWQVEVQRRQEVGDDVSEKSGLQEIFEEISPIEDFSETMSLSFENPVFYDPKYTVEECKEKDFTYSAPLYVSAEFTNNETGEIKGQTVFMGDFPLMSPKGTFIINGTERVVVSQLVRSPGVYFERSADKTSDKDIFTSKLIPSRGAWLEFEIDKRDLVGVRLDRKRKQNVTVLLKALAAVAEEIGEAYDYDAIMADLREYESIQLTEEKDNTQGPDDDHRCRERRR